MTPAVNKIFADETSDNMWTSRTPWQVIRVGVNKNTSGNIGHACGISETSSTDMIEIIGDTAQPCGLIVSQEIGDVWQSTSPDIKNSNKLETSIHQQYTDNLVAPLNFTEVLGDKPFNSSSRYLYKCCKLKLTADTVNIPAPQFMDLGLSTINSMDKGASIWNPSTRVGRPMDVTHGSAPDHIYLNYSN